MTIVIRTCRAIALTGSKGASLPALLLIWTTSFGYAVQRYERCEGDLSCEADTCQMATLQQSTLTENVLCVNKNVSFPLYYNIRGCAGSYTQPNYTSTPEGICLSEAPGNSSIRLTVAKLMIEKHTFTCFQNNQYTFYTVIAYDQENPYKDIIVKVNNNDTDDMVEGAQVLIAIQAVGYSGNIAGETSICSNTRVICRVKNNLCNVGRYFEYFFSSVTLADNGTVVPFILSNGSVLGSVTLIVRPLPSTTIMEPTTEPPISIPPTLTSSPVTSPSLSLSVASTASQKVTTVTSADLTTTSSPSGHSSSDGSHNTLIIIISSVVGIVVVVGVAIVFVYCLCCRSSGSSDEEKGMILRWPSLRKHKVTIYPCMIYPCTTCPINQLADQLKKKENIKVQSFPSDPSEVTLLESNLTLIGCTCTSSQGNSSFQAVLDRCEQQESSNWKIVQLNNNDTPVDGAISYSDIEDESLLDKVVHQVSSNSSGRSSMTVNESMLEEILNKVDQLTTQTDVVVRAVQPQE